MIESELVIFGRRGDFKVTSRCLSAILLAATILVGCSRAEESYVKPRQDALALTEQGHYQNAEAKLIPLIRGMQTNHAQSLANAMQQLAWVYMCDGKFKEAEDMASKAQFSHAKNDSSDVESKILDDYTLATIYRKQSKCSQAEPLYQDAIELRQEQLKKNVEPPADKIVSAPRLASLLLGMGELQFDLGKYKEADSLLKEAIKLAEADRLEKKPGSADVLAEALVAICNLDSANGKFLDAEGVVNRAIALKTTGVDPHGPTALLIAETLLQILSLQHRYIEADGTAQTVWLQANAIFRADHPDILRAKFLNMPNLPHLHPEVPHQEIEAIYDRLIANFADAYGAENPHMIEPYQAAGVYSLSVGDFVKAESNFRAALALANQNLPPHHPRLIELNDDLAMTLGFKDLNSKNRAGLAEAKKLARTALSREDDSLPDDHPLRAKTLGLLASIFTVDEDYEAAFKTFQEYLAVSRKVNYEDPLDRIRFLKNYQIASEKTGHSAEAGRVKALFADMTPVVHASVGSSGKVPLVLK
ncbi:MAG TPA: tetratricopeptide repeat protein [Drouetiella sp.]